MSPQLNRREILSVMGTAGAVAAVAGGRGSEVQSGPRRARPIRQAGGRPGQDDGSPGRRGRALLRGGALRLRHSGSPEQRALGRLQGPARSLICSSPTSPRPASWPTPRRAPRARSACFSVVPGPGLTNALTGIGEALYRQHPDGRASSPTSIDRAEAPVGQVHRTGQLGHPPAGRQGVDRGPPPGRDPRRDLSGIPAGPVRRTRAGRGADPVPLLTGGLGLRPGRCRPLPRPVRRGRLRQGALPICTDRRRRVGIYAGLGCVDAGPVPGRGRRDAPGAGGDVGQRQGAHPRLPPPGRRLGLRQAGDPGRGGRLQGRRSRPGRRRPLQRGLDGQLRHSPGTTR